MWCNSFFNAWKFGVWCLKRSKTNIIYLVLQFMESNLIWHFQLIRFNHRGQAFQSTYLADKNNSRKCRTKVISFVIPTTPGKIQKKSGCREKLIWYFDVQFIFEQMMRSSRIIIDNKLFLSEKTQFYFCWNKTDIKI